jgi:hypothetical protein
MRIISKHKDYYDTALKMGADNLVIYKRELTEYSEANGKGKDGALDGPFLDIFDQINDFVQRKEVDKKASAYKIDYAEFENTAKKLTARLERFGIAFCGDVYRGLALKIIDHNGLYAKESTEYFYESDALNHAIETLGLKRKASPSYAPKMKVAYDPIDIYFSHDVTDSRREFLIENKIVCASVMKSGRSRFGKNVLTINPILADFQFFKVMDPYKAHQEISMWLGGVLTNNTKIPEPEDKLKVLMHGFNKMSFKHRPE